MPTSPPVLLFGNAADAANLRYASGFAAPDACVYLRTATRRLLVVPAMEFRRAGREAAPGTEVLTPAELPAVKVQPGRAQVAWCRALLQHAGIRQVAVSAEFPLAAARELERHGIRVDVAPGEILPARAVKTAAEIAAIRGVQAAAVAAMSAARTALRAATVDPAGRLRLGRAPLTAERVRHLMDHELLEHDCVSEGTIVAAGDQAVDPHERGSGPLPAGVPIVIDVFPRHRGHGYWGDLTRTLIKGRPRPELARMYRAVQGAQALALGMIRPRAGRRTIYRAVLRYFARQGYATRLKGGPPEGFIHAVGHGIGLDVHEAPGLRDAPGRLRAGHVVTVEPGLYYPGLGGIRIEDVVVVTARGAAVLVACDRRFQV